MCCCVVGFPGFEAIVTRLAIRSGVFLAEIFQQLAAPARRTLGVVHHQAELFAGDLLLLRALHLLNKVRLLRGIAGIEKQQAIRRQSVAPGPAGLLIIPFNVFRQVVVNDPAHVRFVNPHAERDGRADNPNLVSQKKLLIRRALVRRKAGMIWAGRKPAVAEALCKPVRGRPRRAIDDPAVHRTLSDKLRKLPHPLVLGNHAIGKVRPVETRDKNGGIAKLQMPDNILADTSRRGCRECGHRHIRQQCPQTLKLPVFRAEVVSPLRDAMRLVDRKGTHIPIAEIFLPVVEHEALGRGVEQAELPLVQPAQSGFAVRDLERRIQKCRCDSSRFKLVHLILHQRDQRRNHHGQTFSQQRWKLEAKRFPPSGRQQRKCIAPGQRGLDDLALERTEFVIAECLLQRFLNVVHSQDSSERMDTAPSSRPIASQSFSGCHARALIPASRRSRFRVALSP